MLSPDLCQLLGYWRSLGGGKTVPERSLLDLRQLTNLLPWMFILEMGPDGGLRYRLAGSSLESALGRGMAGRTYSEIFSDHEQAAVMEELYAIAIVQSCGILRTGAFSFDEKEHFDMEVLALPFIEMRAMGGVVLVGVVRPFEAANQGFVDRWGGFRHDLTELLVVPSPRVMALPQLSPRVRVALEIMSLDIKAMDVEKVLEIDRLGTHGSYSEIPSVTLEHLTGAQTQNLN